MIGGFFKSREDVGITEPIGSDGLPTSRDLFTYFYFTKEMIVMNKETLLRTLRFVGMLCAIFLSVIGALGIDVPSIQEVVPASWTAVIVAVASALANHWYNNNYTAGAKMAQPLIKEFNDSLKNEVDDMGKGDDHE